MHSLFLCSLIPLFMCHGARPPLGGTCPCTQKGFEYCTGMKANQDEYRYALCGVPCTDSGMSQHRFHPLGVKHAALCLNLGGYLPVEAFLPYRDRFLPLGTKPVGCSPMLPFRRASARGGMFLLYGVEPFLVMPFPEWCREADRLFRRGGVY